MVTRAINRNHLDIQSTLQRLWYDHVAWTRFFIISSAHNMGDLSSVTKRLLRNPTDFGNVLRKYYSAAAVSEFEKLFTDHLLIAAKLVDAAKKGNTQEAHEFEREWYRNADDLARFFA